MKIAGLTWWRNNYGSILQAYALQSYLNSQDDIEYDIVCQFGKKIASIDNLKDKIKRLGFCETIKKAFWKYFFRKLRKRNTLLYLVNLIMPLVIISLDVKPRSAKKHNRTRSYGS